MDNNKNIDMINGVLQEKLISIIIPAYNAEKFLHRCVNSVIKQTYNNFEIIIVNDGSSDDTGLIAEKYKKKDARIRVIHQNNGGLSAARNAGIESALGEYIFFADSDDFIEANALSELINIATDFNADLVICNFKYVNENDDELRTQKTDFNGCRYFSKEEILENYYKENGVYYVVAWNKLYKKDLWKEIRYPVGRIREDEFVFLDLIEQSNKIICSDKILYNYVQTNSSISHVRTNNFYIDGTAAHIQRFILMLQRKYKKNVIDKQKKLIKDCFGVLLPKCVLSNEEEKNVTKLQNLYINILKEYKMLNVADIIEKLTFNEFREFLYFSYRIRNKIKRYKLKQN